MRGFLKAISIVLVSISIAFANSDLPAPLIAKEEPVEPAATMLLAQAPETPQPTTSTEAESDEAAAKEDPPKPSKTERSKTRKKKSKRRYKTETREKAPFQIMAKDAKVQTPATSKVLESKTIYSYIPDAVYRVYGAPLHIVDVQLQPGETITSKITAGDTVRWTVGVVSHGVGANRVQHVLIKPEQPGLETNFIITTDRHSYHLSAKSDPRFYIPTAGWNYPQEEMAKLDIERKEDERLESMVASSALRPENLNFKYKIEGKDNYKWTPVRVFDDGQKTYIQMSPEMKNYEAPALFIKTKEGLNLVNYRVKGEFYVVDRLFTEAELRSGKHDIVSIRREKKGWWPWSD